MEDKQFLLVWRINGVPFTGRCVGPRDKAQAEYHLRALCQRRNVNIAHQRMLPVAVYEIGTDITAQRACEFEAENRLQKEIAGLPAPEDTDRDHPDRILHEPIAA
jgi:hypothetical protein